MGKCFAYNDKNQQCSALMGSADCGICAFYKTEEQHVKDRAKAQARCKKIGVLFDKQYEVYAKAREKKEIENA